MLDSDIIIWLLRGNREILAAFDAAKTHSVTLADAFIAATAQISEAYLWTLNRKHFPMIEAENFYSPQV